MSPEEEYNSPVVDVEEKCIDSSSVDKNVVECLTEASGTSASVAEASGGTISRDQIFNVMGEFGHVS